MRRQRLIAFCLLTATAAAQLPAPIPPTQNPTTPAKVLLGKFLFWDEQLSSDDSTACGTCHLPELGGVDGRVAQSMHPGPDKVFGTADDIRGALGIHRQASNGDFVPTSGFGLRRQATRRASQTTLGAAHHGQLFWDGRADGQLVDPETGLQVIPYGSALETQALEPILSPVEMGQEGRTWQDVRTKLQQVTPLALASNLGADLVAGRQQFPSYPALFNAAFGDPAITAVRIGMALASYQRTLNPDDTPWDRFMAGQTTAMTASEQAGWQLFQNQGRCIACHWEPLFSDDLPHNLGLRWQQEDLGYGALTGLPDDQGAFKTPTLRNAGLRPRLFHNGQSPSLADPGQLSDPASTLNVYFVGGGVDASNLDPFLLPLGQLGITTTDLILIQDFVRTALTDQRAAQRLPPFDHPDLRSMVQAPPRQFGPGLAAGMQPFLIDSLPSYPGNANFKLGLVGGPAGSLSALTYGFQSFEPHLQINGLPWHLQVHDWLLFPLGGTGSQPGHTTWRLPLPNDPSLAPIPFYFQLLVLDPMTAGGIASSRGYEYFIR